MKCYFGIYVLLINIKQAFIGDIVKNDFVQVVNLNLFSPGSKFVSQLDLVLISFFHLRITVHLASNQPSFQELNWKVTTLQAYLILIRKSSILRACH